MIVIGEILLGIFILFFPGFLLSFLLYAGSKALDFWERVALSVGLSALTVMLIILILAQPPLRALRFAPFVGSVLAFCGVCGGLIALWKERRRTFLNFWTRSETGE